MSYSASAMFQDQNTPSVFDDALLRPLWFKAEDGFVILIREKMIRMPDNKRYSLREVGVNARYIKLENGNCLYFIDSGKNSISIVEWVSGSPFFIANY